MYIHFENRAQHGPISKTGTKKIHTLHASFHSMGPIDKNGTKTIYTLHFLTQWALWIGMQPKLIYTLHLFTQWALSIGMEQKNIHTAFFDSLGPTDRNGTKKYIHTTPFHSIGPIDRNGTPRIYTLHLFIQWALLIGMEPERYTHYTFSLNGCYRQERGKICTPFHSVFILFVKNLCKCDYECCHFVPSSLHQ